MIKINRTPPSYDIVTNTKICGTPLTFTLTENEAQKLYEALGAALPPKPILPADPVRPIQPPDLGELDVRPCCARTDEFYVVMRYTEPGREPTLEHFKCDKELTDALREHTSARALSKHS